MAAASVLEHFELNPAERRCATIASEQAPVVGSHQLLGRGVVHLPQTHELRLRSGDHQCTAQAVDTFAYRDFSQSRFAGGKHHELRSPEVEPRDLQGSEDAISPGGGLSQLARPAVNRER